MPARIHLNLYTEEALERIDADSFLAALDASLEILHELDTASVSGGRFRWYYAHLAVGSGHSIVEGELAEDGVTPDEREQAEHQIESLYVNGLTSLDRVARIPTGFTYRAIEAALRLGSVLSDSVTQIVISAPSVGPQVVLSEKVIANVKELMGRGFTDIGSIEGKLETISLARSPTFNVRDEVTGESVVCVFKIERLDEVKEALGRRVLVSGEVTYNKRGMPSEVSPVDAIRLLDQAEVPTVDAIRGIEPDITEGLPVGLYVRKRFYGT